MKKILLFIVLLLSLSACSLSNTPTGKVEAYLNQYNSLTDNVKVDMESKVTSENLSSDNADIYRNVLTRQYQDMKYEVKDEKIDGENATITVKVTVYDLYKIDRDAYNYLNDHQDEFKKNDVYDKSLFTDYKLKKLKDVNKTVDYTIDFQLTKVDGKWEVNDLSNEQLEKIHGVYAY